ncbi:MAG: L-threonylcarbamoyladenylate synthase [Ignavibacteria bacterium]
MKTILTKSSKTASKFIKSSRLVAFPTETVYGLGANVFDEYAVKKIFKVKGRPFNNPLIVHISDKKQIDILSKDIPHTAKKIIKKFFPGPITVILNKNEIISERVTAGLDTIAVRMPSSVIARNFIKQCGVPIAAPSANLSGSPSPTSYLHVLQDFKGKIPCILLGPKSKYGLESTVVDCTVRIPAVLRPGVITLEELRKLDKRIKLKVGGKIKSPGQKYKHYSPKAKVKLIEKMKSPGETFAYIGLTSLNKNVKKNCKVYKVCKNETDYAKNLFSFFRECDDKDVKIIYAQKVKEKGIGLAIMNRLKKASEN